MRFALVDGQRRTAEKGLTGICPACGGPVLAKCGEKKSHHWAHKRQCSDTWATGKETDWHLGWKNCFPEAWQERILKDVQSGEKHIADILTEHNLVLEFQHSPIDPEERRAREYFYSQGGRRMAWVVDCTQHQRDLKRCKSYIEDYHINISRPSIVSSPDEFFPSKWIPISFVPIVLDIGWFLDIHDNNGVCYYVMPCLFVFKFEEKYYCGCKLFFKDEFIELAKDGKLLCEIESNIKFLIGTIKARRAASRMSYRLGYYLVDSRRYPYIKKSYRGNGRRKIGGRSRRR